MNSTLLVIALLCASLHAAPTLLFEDDFNRNESDDSKEELGQGWGTNSKKRANGNKQVDLKDGAMHITFHPSADHAVSVTHPAGFTNGSVHLRFMLPGKKDSLGVNFADLKCKDVHAGHLCIARITTTHIELSDRKTGVMNLELRKARMAKTLTAEQQALLKTKTKRFPHQLETGKWHKLEVRITGDTLTTFIDDQETATFASEGIAHPTKRLLRLAVPKKAVIDDIQVYSIPPAE